jgi:hypothetical protein
VNCHGRRADRQGQADDQTFIDFSVQTGTLPETVDVTKPAGVLSEHAKSEQDGARKQQAEVTRRRIAAKMHTIDHPSPPPGARK